VARSSYTVLLIAAAATAVNAQQVTINGSAGTFTGSISGSGSLVNSGGGTFTLSGDVTNTGLIRVDSGKLNVTGTLRSGASLEVASGATLNLDNVNIFVSTHGTPLTPTQSIVANGGTIVLTSNFDSRLGDITLNGATLTSNRGLSGYDAFLTNTTSGAAIVTVGGSSASLMNGSGGIHLGTGVRFVVADVTNSSASDLTVSLQLDNGGQSGGSGSLVKEGAGAMVLSGSNTFSGGTTLSAGSLRVGHNSALGSGTATLNGGALSSDSSTARSLSNNLVMGGNVTLGDATNNGALTFSGSVGLGGATRTLTVASAVTLSGVVSNGGITKAGTGTLTLSSAATHTGGTTINAGTLQVGVTPSFASDMKSMLGTGTIIINDGGTLQTLNHHQLGWSAGSHNSITINDGGTLATGAFDHFLGTVVLNDNASITGSSGYIGLATGSLTYTGSSASKQATLSKNIALSIQSTPVNATFTVNGTNTSGDLVINGSIYQNGSSLTKAGTGMLVLAGANTYGGGTILNAGTLRLGYAEVAGVSGPLGASGVITLGGGTLQYTATNTFDYSSRFSTAANQSYRVDTNGQNITWASALTSSGGALVKSGAGALTLSAANSFSGGTTLSAGTLRIGNNTALGSGTATLNGGNLSSNSASARSLTNNVVIGGDVTLGDSTNNGALSISGTVGLGGATRILTIDSAVTLSGVISNGGLTKAGTGTLTLSAAATHSGGTTINAGTLRVGVVPTYSTSMLGSGAITVNGGTLQALNHHQFGFNSGSHNAITINDGGTLNSGSFDQYLGTVTLNDNASITGSGGYIGLAAGSLTYVGTSASKQATIAPSVTLSSPVGAVNATITVTGTNTSGDLVINGAIWQNGSSLTKAGAGMLVMAGTNTYTSGTILNAGTIRLSSAEIAGTSGPLGSGGTITFGGGSLQHTATNTFDYSSRFSTAVNQSYKVDTNGQNVTWSSALTSSGGTLAKSGTGTLTLNNANTFTGETTVSAGTLALGAAGSIAHSSRVKPANGSILDVSAKSDFTLGSAQTLSGGGTVVGDMVIAGTHTPGFSPGLQTFSNNLTYANGSIIVWELTSNSTDNRGVNFDAIDVLGNLTFQGTVNLELVFDNIESVIDWTSSFWDSALFGEFGWKIFDVTGSINDFANLQIANLQIANVTWRDSNNVALLDARPYSYLNLYQGVDGIYLNYSPIPEPSTYGLILGGLALAGAAIRRRKSVHKS
jgi:autotransporter-associated beta strand protein